MVPPNPDSAATHCTNPTSKFVLLARTSLCPKDQNSELQTQSTTVYSIWKPASAVIDCRQSDLCFEHDVVLSFSAMGGAVKLKPTDCFAVEHLIIDMV